MPNVCNLCIRLVWLCQHKMVMMLQKQHIPLWLGDLIAILCVFLLRKQFTHYICRKTIYALFCHENDLRIPSGKFLRVEFRHPESSDFLGLWVDPYLLLHKPSCILRILVFVPVYLYFAYPWLFCLSWSIWHLCERGRAPFAVWSVFCWLYSTVLTTILIFAISFIINYYEGDGKLIILTVIILPIIIITIITTMIMRLVCIVLRPRISGFCVVVALLLLLLLSSPWHADEGTSR